MDVYLYRFWIWLRKYSNCRVRRHYMNIYRHDRKCERCETWLSEVDGAKNIDFSLCGWFEYLTCKRCNHVSKWDCRGMIPTLVKSENHDYN